MSNTNTFTVTPANERKRSIFNNYVVTVVKYINDRMDIADMDNFEPFHTFTLSIMDLEKILDIKVFEIDRDITDYIFRSLYKIFLKYGYIVYLDSEVNYYDYDASEYCYSYSRYSSITISIPELVL